MLNMAGMIYLLVSVLVFGKIYFANDWLEAPGKLKECESEVNAQEKTIKTLENQVDDYKDQLLTINGTVSNLKAEKNTKELYARFLAERDSELDDKKREIDNLKRDIENLEIALAAMDGDIHTNNAFQQILQDKIRTIAKLQDSVIVLEQKIARSNSMLNTYEVEFTQSLALIKEGKTALLDILRDEGSASTSRLNNKKQQYENAKIKNPKLTFAFDELIALINLALRNRKKAKRILEGYTQVDEGPTS